MGRVGRKQSLRAMSQAYDAGITFFDTARSYGYGESEAIVGEFLRGRRERVILSTKFGIVPVRPSGWKRSFIPIVRTAVGLVPSIRKLIRRQVRAQLEEQQFTRDVLRCSVEESLRQLRTDYIDILFLHSPSITVLRRDDLFEELEKLVATGRVRAVGISAEPELITAVLQSTPTQLSAMQFPVNLFDISLVRHIKAAQNRGLIFTANHPFGGPDRLEESRKQLEKLSSSPGVSPELRSKLRSGGDRTLGEVILNLILTDTGIQVVVPSMMKLSHLRANIQAVSNCRFTREELAWIRCSLGRPPADGVNSQCHDRLPAPL